MRGRTSALVLALLALPASAQFSEVAFTPLFDGTSLEGWTTTGGRYDGKAVWGVEDGALVGRQGPEGAGGLLYTTRAYSSFELRLDAKLDYPFDSGVFLRMVPPPEDGQGGRGFQVTLDHREGGEIGAIYADGFLEHNEEGAALWREGEWNELVVRCVGFDPRITCTLNGELLVDYRLPADTPGFAPTGLIGLQVHGAREDHGAAYFRNVRVRELSPFAGTFAHDGEGAATLTDEARATGWRPLLDGATLEGWEVHGEDGRYEWEDGALAFRARGGGGELATTEDFRDFRLRLDFRLSRMANSGLFLRAARDGSNPAFSGCEVQILDDFHWEEVTGTELSPWQFTGSLYGAVPPGDTGALRPLGEWNTYELCFRGPRLAVALNGRTLYDVDTETLTADPPFAERARTGFLGLQHHGHHPAEEAPTTVWFRNVFVQSLDQEAR